MQITVTIASNVFDNLNKLLLELTSSIKLRHSQAAVLSSDACLGLQAQHTKVGIELTKDTETEGQPMPVRP